MKISNRLLLIVAVSLNLFATTASTTAQTNGNVKKNNPYSPSPVSKSKEIKTVAVPTSTLPADAIINLQGQNMPTIEEPSTVAQRTNKTTKNAEAYSLPPSEIYKVGIGDVLFVTLKNSPQGSRYCTVLADGKIDFPLGGEDLVAAGQTVDMIAEKFASNITLFPDAQVEVKVREYGSHKITVSGMVENAGDKNLQREAMPLYAIRSEAVVSPKATKAIIKRAPLLKLETYDLHDTATDGVLIYPGNMIEFTSDLQTGSGSYYISGEISSSGQKEFNAGMTLYQAVISSGSIKGEPKKAAIRRKNDNGLFTSSEYNLRSIKDGKVADPALQPGDVIDVRK